MTYDVRFRNGQWIMFNLERYEPAKVFALQREAEQYLTRARKPHSPESWFDHRGRQPKS